MNYDVFEQLCKDNGTTPTALSKKLGLSKGNTTSWKKGGNPSVEVLMQISVELHCTTDYLLTGKKTDSKPVINVGERLQPDEQELLKNYKRLPEKERIKLISRAEAIADVYADAAQSESYIDLPYDYDNGAVSAGFGENLSDYEKWDVIQVAETPESRKADFCLKVQGDSMQPAFHDGDIVLIRKQPSVFEGEIGIFDIDGKGYIKKLGTNRLISLNDNYDDILFNDCSDIRCFGLVLGIADVNKE